MSEIQELYDRDPMQLSEQDLKTIIADLRSKRKAFNQGAAQAARSPAKSKPKVLPDLDFKL